MKKMVWALLFSILLASFLPFGTLVSADEALPPLWDGSAAQSFAGGDGSEHDPYRIESAAQFAYFCDQVNTGNSFDDKHVALYTDLCLNDESFFYEPDTGLVKVTDGIHTAYCGTGKKGQKGGNTEFDNIASLRNQWYDENLEEIDDYPGQLLPWTCIGAAGTLFKGSFDGREHTVSGVFIPPLFSHSGLFYCIDDASLKNLHMANSFVLGNERAGGLVGAVKGSGHWKDDWSTIRSCSFDGVVAASTHVGGIVGYLYKTPFLSMCENKGTIVGDTAVGGIVGYGENARDCLNNGNIFGGENTGGICGESGNVSSGTVSGPGIYRCTNNATVTGSQYVGGICGHNSRSLTNCHNTGAVVGVHYVGGICGDASNNTIRQCQSIGARIEGNANVGGIAGKGNANNCYNTSDIVGQANVGGICGSGKATNSKNMGSIMGSGTSIGGVVGDGSAAACCNYGAVSGTMGAGGVVGYATEVVRVCYNRGAVISSDGWAGGIAGGSQGELSGCYNVGTVKGVPAGALVGRHINTYGTAKLSYVYYLKGCATDHNGTVQAAVGDVLHGDESIAALAVECSAEEMTKKDTYIGLDFKNVWQENESYPTLQILKTPHEITETVTEDCLYREASCTEAALYRKTCSCGAVQDAFFTAGEKTEHAFGDWMADTSLHIRRCALCQTASEELHLFDTKEVTITDTTGKVIMHCAACGYEEHLSFSFTPPTQSPPEEDPPKETPVETPQKAEMKIDLRFVLLFAAGVVLGVIGCYGTSVIRKMRTDVKKKQKMSKNFI